MAQSIHNASERSTDPLSPSTVRHFRKIFWKVNCLAMQTVHLPEAGAVGKWDFLSRLIGELCFWMKYQKSPSIFQGKLLRALQERQIRRIGDDKVVDVDTRIIAATNRNLRQMVIDHEFRQDLLYRLDVLKVYIPPFERKDSRYSPLFSYFLTSITTNLEKILQGLHQKHKKCFATIISKGISENYAILQNGFLLCVNMIP